MKKFRIVILLLVLSACSPKLIESTETLSVGQTRKVKLNSLPSAGYTNKVTIDNPDVLKIKNERYRSNRILFMKPGGDRGKEIYVFKALSKGTATITMTSRTSKRIVKIIVK